METETLGVRRQSLGEIPRFQRGSTLKRGQSRPQSGGRLVWMCVIWEGGVALMVKVWPCFKILLASDPLVVYSSRVGRRCGHRSTPPKLLLAVVARAGLQPGVRAAFLGDWGGYLQLRGERPFVCAEAEGTMVV